MRQLRPEKSFGPLLGDMDAEWKGEDLLNF